MKNIIFIYKPPPLMFSKESESGKHFSLRFLILIFFKNNKKGLQMRNIYLAGMLFSCMLFVFGNYAEAQVTTTFNFTGGVQTFTIPPGVTSVDVTAQGGMGGDNAGVSMSDRPGYGGCVSATLAVTPGTVLSIYVGGVGGNSTTSAGGPGGYNGGGNGALGYSPYAGGGGGGASDIRMGGVALANRVIVAGGGGGAGGNYFLPAIDYDRGGDGGGTTGEAGSDGGTVGAGGGGGGGGPLSGGGPGSYAGWGTGTSGVSGIGGAAGAPSGGGGGGGGYFGGGGGSWGGGGGGSNYTDPLLASAVLHTRGCNTTGAGLVTITLTCVPPVPGAIVGPTNICSGGGTATYTNPTGSTGGTWSSSNPFAVTIDPVTGVATGIAPGATVIITYSVVLSCGSASTSTTVNVIPAPAPITGGPDSMCLSSFSVTNVDTFLDATPGGIWSSSTTTVATIDSLTGIATSSTTTSGTTTIIYTAGGCTATVVLTVNPLPSAIAGPATVCRFLSIILTDPTSGGTWSSTVPGAATVGSTTGVVTGVGIGATNIIYTLPTGCSSDPHFVAVSQPPLPITGPSQVCLSNTIILTELVGGGLWSSSAPLNASVIGSLSNGIVNGLNPSVVTISYTTPACPPATHVVTVNPLPAIITGTTAICAGFTTTLYDATPGGAWVSGDPAVFISSTGDVTSSDTSISATIYYILPTTCFVSTMVNVNAPPPPITGTTTICNGTSTTLTDLRPGGIWSSTDLAIAQVIDSSGVVSGIANGTVNISYTLATGCFAYTSFIVQPLLPGSVNVTSSPGGIICDSTIVTFTATAVNGGVPTYVWEKFSTPVSGVDSTGTYSYMAIHGDAIMVLMMPHGVCALHDTVIDTVVLNIYPNNVTPVITIMTTSPGPITSIGQVVTFFSSVTYGGTVQTFQWYLNGNPIPGATNSSYSTAIYAQDTFWCVVNGNPPCSTTFPVPPGTSNKIVIQDFLGVHAVINGNNELTLFPNPNNGSFTLSGKLADNAGNNVSYEVTNMLGQKIYTGSSTPQNGMIKAEISLNDVAPGSYLMRVNTGTGNETFHFVIGR